MLLKIMENKNNNLESGFKINSLLLLESNFSRINNVAFGEAINNDIGINVEVGVKDQLITVIEEVTLTQKLQDVEQVKIRVKMVGVFECFGETELTNFDEFGRINGAAIIFPYIREHVTNVSLKAGIGPIILPPINFTKNKQEK
jgi:preprotein translocase subunit SecB